MNPLPYTLDAQKLFLGWDRSPSILQCGGIRKSGFPSLLSKPPVLTRAGLLATQGLLWSCFASHTPEQPLGGAKCFSPDWSKFHPWECCSQTNQYFKYPCASSSFSLEVSSKIHHLPVTRNICSKSFFCCQCENWRHTHPDFLQRTSSLKIICLMFSLNNVGSADNLKTVYRKHLIFELRVILIGKWGPAVLFSSSDWMEAHLHIGVPLGTLVITNSKFALRVKLLTTACMLA